MAGAKIALSSTSGELKTDGNDNARVNLPMTLAHSGYAVIAGESHDGATGEARLVRTARVSTDGRLRVGVDAIYWQDTFNHAQQDTSAYQVVSATATTAMTGGYWVFNSGNSVASGAVARIQTYKTFPLNAFSSLEVGFRLRFAALPQTNNVCEFGLGFATTTTTPTDGVYFKLTSGGVLQGVMNINGTETTTAAMTSFTANEVKYYRMVIDQDRIEFYIDGVLEGVILGPTTAPAVSFARALPLLMRLYNSAAVSTAQRLEVADVCIAMRDIDHGRPYPMIQSGNLCNAISTMRGVAPGQTANYANTAAPTSATLSNTAAGYTTLGGQWQFAAVAGAETDYVLFGFQVTAAAAASANKNLFITGIRIETVNLGAAVATTATVLQWGLGIGGTAVSLVTADSATAGSRAARRIALGLQSFAIGAAIGTVATPIVHSFQTPLVAEAGTFVHVILKMPVGTATASQIVRGTCLIEGFFE
ncbi:MAG: hypothetical protein E6R03_09755 [Hyphomicrobiaceae bacterium]|nr:MAG: hypothetical protein E6R03_09755 [Hyphomicrobiaceae bacterium]